MDNNNFNDGMSNQQNMQNGMPNVQSMQQGMSMPMNGQPGPMGQPMQPNMGPMGPYPQPIMRPPKQPMDPAKKKQIILIISIVSGVLVLGIALAIILPIVLKTDYSSTYKTAVELKPYIYDIYQSYDCEYVIDYVDYSYISDETYAEYIDGCKDVYNSSVNELISKLESTSGVKKDDAIGNQFAKFKSEYDKISTGNMDELNYKLGLWQAWHSYEVASDDLSYSSGTDAEFAKAASYLVNSGNDTLKNYGEGWLEKSLALSAAYRSWDQASYSISNYQALRDDYYNKRNEISDWIAMNEPDISSVAPLNFNDTSKMYTEFDRLYTLIVDSYQKNYNFGSGDCSEILDQVICD